MKSPRYSFFWCIVLLLIFSVACNKDSDEVVIPKLTPEEQLSIFVTDSLIEGASINVRSFDLSGGTGYYWIQDTIAADTGQLELGISDIVYFHYSLSFLQVDLDTVSMDTVISNPISFIAFDSSVPSNVGRVGTNSIWPVGLDLMLQSMTIKEAETYYIYLPPSLSYQNIALNQQIINRPIEIGLHIDSIKNLQAVYDEETFKISQYIIDEQLRDTVAVPGGLVETISTSSGNVFYKRLGNETQGILPSAVNLDSATINFTYSFVGDSQTETGALELSSVPTSYSFVVGGNMVMEGLETGIQSMRVGERALMIYGPALAYREAICFLPDLRRGQSFFGDRDGSSTNKAKQYLIDNRIVPSYAFQTEPFRSYVFDVTLEQIN